jgi:hypothetical protein
VLADRGAAVASADGVGVALREDRVVAEEQASAGRALDLGQDLGQGRAAGA